MIKSSITGPQFTFNSTINFLPRSYSYNFNYNYFMVAYMMMVLFNKLINGCLLEGQMIELIWTILPAITLIFIALPSLPLLYLMDELNKMTL